MDKLTIISNTDVYGQKQYSIVNQHGDVYRADIGLDLAQRLIGEFEKRIADPEMDASIGLNTI